MYGARLLWRFLSNNNISVVKGVLSEVSPSKISTKRDLTVHTDEELRILLSMSVDVEVWDKITQAVNLFVQPNKI